MAKIGEFKIQTGSGPASVPVYETGDSGSGVYEMLRTQTEGGTGFIPLTDPSDAAYSFLRVQTDNYGVLAVHDADSVSAGTFPYSEGFESGNLSGWTTGSNANTSVTTKNAYSGSYCLGVEDTSIQEVASYDFGSGFQISTFSWVWYETSDSTGFMIRLNDSSGTPVVGAGSNNPQWDFFDDSGFSQFDSGTDYQRYIKAEMTFDWSNSQVEIIFTDQSTGYSDTVVAQMNSSSNVRYIDIGDYSNSNFNDEFGNCYTWFDDFYANT